LRWQERTPYHYRSSDGLDIPGYLTLPKGLPARNLPLIVHPHGGPWARDSFGYDTYAQFLSNRGYAVLQPNFRGFHQLRQEIPQRRKR